VGDFVVLAGTAPAAGARAPTVIVRVLTRRSLFARKRPGISRVERFIEALRTGCEAPALLVVNKADTVTDAAAWAGKARASIPGIDACAISARTGEGIEDLRRRWAPGDTVALAGSSGVGKSTLVNALCGVSVGTAETRGDGRGRHTTTTRRAYVTTDGALLIDTPGMREIGVFSEDAGGGTGFADIEELAKACRFRDCRHEREPGCAVLEAVAAGPELRATLRAS
jgi:ribosome biogenesis GTPase